MFQITVGVGTRRPGGSHFSPAFILQPSIASWATFAGRPRDMLATAGRERPANKEPERCRH